ncbi:Cell wall-active antibiotics response 4TMS YvqF [Streptomyces zhaozhouensis]|uniref:Cell wall-active antibiotics response 4TMS YvqF n=1 Tax=Streptomyces zhaozhouensis TaxID=1300267 RepID=A0A286DQY0_9ACTN|nr:DUF1707 domain-containing protein [Streptomyces zhaozhouensis]SOD61078.1 Cell wall-active antibiotics response 4TMS YvqF [Streptomyces zhaozhouensis]
MSLEKSAEPEHPAPAPATGAPSPAPAAAHGPGAVRASDADRDRIADILREALAEGRLEPDEHAERLDALYRSKTLGELQPLIGDLPAGQRSQPPGPAAPGPGPGQGRDMSFGGHKHGGIRVAGAKNVVAVFSSANRAGTWRVGSKVSAVAVFGYVELDLTEALFEQQHVTINATSVFGGVEIRVPENVTLRSNGSGVMGGFEVREREATDLRAPVITVQGAAIMGSVEVKAIEGKRLRDLGNG